MHARLLIVPGKEVAVVFVVQPGANITNKEK